MLQIEFHKCSLCMPYNTCLINQICLNSIRFLKVHIRFLKVHILILSGLEPFCHRGTKNVLKTTFKLHIMKLQNKTAGLN